MGSFDNCCCCLAKKTSAIVCTSILLVNINKIIINNLIIKYKEREI